MTAVRNSGWTFEYIPKDLKTRDICLVAVRKLGDAPQFVPEGLKTEDICLAAVERDL
jgi:hypothetical protein